MMYSRRRNILILIIVFVLIGGGLGWYFYSQRGEEPGKPGPFERIFGGGRLPIGGEPTPPPGGEPGGEVQPPTTLGTGLFQITNKETIGATFVEKGEKFRYVLRENGHVFEAETTNAKLEPKEISNTTMAGITRASWSPDGSSVITQFFSQDKIRHFLLNLSKPSSSIFLPDGLNDIQWSSSGKEFAFTKFQNNKSTLGTLNASGKNQVILYESPMADLRGRWITTNELALTQPASGFAQSAILILNKTSKALSIFKGPAFGLGFLFAPSGDSLVMSETNEEGRNLRATVQDRRGRILYTLTSPALADKCGWKPDSKALYCLIPKGLAQGALPDEFYQGFSLGADLLAKIDFENQKDRFVWELPFEAKSILANPTGEAFLIIKKEDESLWLLKVK